MRVVVLILAVGLAVVAAAPKSTQKIVGGSITPIEAYPSAAALLFSWTGVTYTQACGGSIINNRAILSAAHCFDGFSTWQWRIRVGSPYASSGGYEHTIDRIIRHPNYNAFNFNNDVSVLHSDTIFVTSDRVRPGTIAGANYNLGDHQVVWAVGWGRTGWTESTSEELRHVQVWTVNQEICRVRYVEVGHLITDNMLCSGWVDVGGRDQCIGDSGGALFHNGVIVGVCSWGEECAHPRYPGINARVSHFTDWIISNA